MIDLRNLTLTINGYSHLGPVALRYSITTDRRGNRRVFWYFADRSLEYILKDDAVRTSVERACLRDDARYSRAKPCTHHRMTLDCPECKRAER